MNPGADDDDKKMPRSDEASKLSSSCPERERERQTKK
jgi:hypothetical protein